MDVFLLRSPWHISLAVWKRMAVFFSLARRCSFRCSSELSGEAREFRPGAGLFPSFFLRSASPFLGPTSPTRPYLTFLSSALLEHFATFVVFRTGAEVGYRRTVGPVLLGPCVRILAYSAKTPFSPAVGKEVPQRS